MESSSQAELKTLEQVQSSAIQSEPNLTESRSVKAKWPTPIVENFDDPDWPSFDHSDNDILKWVMSNKRILIRTVTWNMCAKPPPQKDQLLESLLIKKFHIYFIGTEECERSIAQSALNPSKKNWEAYLSEALGEMFVPLRSHTLQAIHLIVFVHRALVPMCSIVTSVALPTGVGNTLGNKGSVAISLKFGSFNFLVINAHLSAHQKATKQRNAEFQKMNRTIPNLLEKKEPTLGSSAGFSSFVVKPSEGNNLPTSTSPTTTLDSNNLNNKTNMQEISDPAVKEIDVMSDDAESDDGNEEDINKSEVAASNPNIQADLEKTQSKAFDKSLDQCGEFVIFMGDLNYRIKGNRSIVEKLLKSNMHEVLLSNDQLNESKSKGLVFEKFTEPPLNFKPTYKYDIGTNDYDTSAKSRIPSWTDRILYVENPNVTCLAYNSIDSISTSDHKPVYASFLVQFTSYVELDENQNLVNSNNTNMKFTSESQVCNIM